MSYRRAKNLDKDLIFAEYFNSEQEVRRNGSINVGASAFVNTYIDKGKWIADSALSTRLDMLLTRPQGAEVSFRIRCNISNIDPGTTRYFLDPRLGNGGTKFFSWVANGIGVTILNTSNVYINGVQTSSLIGHENEWIDIIATGTLADKLNQTAIGRYHAGTTMGQINFDSIDVFDKILTAEEVSNLYNDARYVLPNLEHGEQLGEELATGWNTEAFWGTKFDPNWSVVNGTLVSNGNSGSLIKPSFWDLTKKYKVSITTDRTSGSVSYPYNGLSPTYISTSGTFTRYYEPVSSATLNVYSLTYNGAVTSISIREVTVEPTSKILHVHAFDGVPRNVLSGDKLPNIVTGWTHSTTYPYESITISGLDITNAINSVTHGSVYSNSFSGVTGEQYFVKFNLTSNSVTLPSCLVMSNGDAIGGTSSDTLNPVVGENSHVFTLTSTNASMEFVFRTKISGDEVDFSITNFTFQKVIPEVTNTAIEVVKEGQVRVPRFNGIFPSGSVINCGNYNDLLGDLTLLSWIRFAGAGYAGGGNILSTDKTSFYTISTAGAPSNVRINSDGIINKYFATQFEHHKTYFLAITRKANGDTRCWVDGIENTADSGSDATPVATTASIKVGNSNNEARAWDGTIPEVQVLSGLLTPEEISQYYTATKHLYNK